MTTPAETKAEPPQDQVIIDQFLNAMKEGDSDEVLKNAFKVLSKDQTCAPVSADVLRRAMENAGFKLTKEEVEDIIRQVKPDKEDQEQINCEEFIKIIKLLKDPSLPVNEQLSKIYGVLCRKDEETRRVVLYGKSGVGKTWLAKKTADRAVTQGIFDIALWIYPNRSIEESVIYQLSIAPHPDESKAKEEADEDLEEEWENDEELENVDELGENEKQEKLKEKREKLEEKLKEKREKLEEKEKREEKKQEEVKNMIPEKLEGKKVLLVFDDGSSTEIDALFSENSELYKLLAINKWRPQKVVRTSKEPSPNEFGIMVRPLTLDESINLVVGDSGSEKMRELVEFFIDKSKRLPSKVMKELAKFFIDKTERLPSEVGSEKMRELAEFFIAKTERLPSEVGSEEMREMRELAEFFIDKTKRLPSEVGSEKMRKLAEFFIDKTERLPSEVRSEKMRELAEKMRELAEKIMGELAEKMRELAKVFIDETGRLPSEVLIIAKTVNYIIQSNKGLQKLQIVKEMILEKNKSVKEMTLEDKSHNVIQLLINESDLFPKSVLIDCYSSETTKRHFLDGHKIVNYNELISYWIMEKHLGPFDRIEDAYEEGHRVFMDLVECGLLKKVEAGYVVSSGRKFDFDIHERYNFYRGIQLGLATTFENKLGKTAVGDGMIRTIRSGHDDCKLSTLLLDGNRFGEVPNGFFKSDCELETLAIFNPTPKSKPFPLPVFKMQNLVLLILRGCEFFKSIADPQPQVPKGSGQESSNLQHAEPGKPQVPEGSERETSNLQHPDPENPQAPQGPKQETSNLQHSQSSPLLKFFGPPRIIETPTTFPKSLTALEISGHCSSETIPDRVFENIPELRNLNLSFLQFKLLPGSFYALTKLEILILRCCSRLKELGSLKNFKNLEVLDLSGSTSVENLHDKSFQENSRLRIIDLSETSIEKLPLVRSNENLKSLSLRDCPALVRIRKINALGTLEVFNFSGSTKVEGFLDPSLDGLKNCKILDGSRTSIKRLPFNIGKVRDLYLKECFQLKELTPFEGVSDVEVLDVSGSFKLEDIKVAFFQNVPHLRELNLSKTGVKNLPRLSSLGELRRLLLSHCEFLEELEELNTLHKLEVLDLSGCGALKELKDEPFDKMERLHTLHLSEIQLDRLPSLQKLTKLKELYVRDCPGLTDLPGLKELPDLEILDHSGTTLETPLSFNHCHPLVIGPSSLSSNFDPEQLLKDLGCNGQPRLDDGSEKSDRPQETLGRGNWSISNWQQPETNGSGENLGVPVTRAHFIHLLEEYPSLLSENFSQFHFCVFPTEAQTDLPDKATYKDELSLRYIYLGPVSPTELNKCLEIRGFSYFPPLPKQLVEQAEFIVLIDNPFLTFLSDFYVDSITTMKACWIERCNKMEHVFGKESNDKLKMLEILWVTDAMELRSISSKDIEDFSFTNLKSLYLEYCPLLSVICSSSLQLEGLESLYIRYCQKIGTLFEDESAKLGKLTKLTLWGLPELKQISCKLEALRHLKVGQCPLLEHEFEGHGKLETLQIKFCDKLKSIVRSLHEEELPSFPKLEKLELWALPELQKIAFKAPSLQSLKVGECPSLESVVDSEGINESLQVLEVKSCENVEAIFKGSNITFGKLDKLELMALPELKRIGASLKGANCMIYGCPKLPLPETLKLQGPVQGERHAESSGTLESNDARNS